MFPAGLRRGNVTLHTCAALPTPSRSSRQGHSRVALQPNPLGTVSGGPRGVGFLHRAGAGGTAGLDAPTAHPGAHRELWDPGVPLHTALGSAPEPGLRRPGTRVGGGDVLIPFRNSPTVGVGSS